MSNIDQDQKPIVIDNGSDMVKAGYGDEEHPRSVFRSIIAKPRSKRTLLSDDGDNDTLWIGDEALQRKGIYDVSYPVEYGIVNDWNDMEKIWSHTFDHELRDRPSEHPVLLTEAPMNPKNNREWMTSIMFEKYEVPELSI